MLFPRLFSTFASGWSGAGLLLMRLVAGITLVSRGIVGLWGDPHLERAILHILSTGAGMLLLAGLWTPIAGVLAAVIELWYAFSRRGDVLTHILLMTLAIALAMVGPGTWWSMLVFLDGSGSTFQTGRTSASPVWGTFVALKMRSRASPCSGHEVSIEGWSQAGIDS